MGEVLCSVQIARDISIRRSAKRCVNNLSFYIGQTVQAIETAATNDTYFNL